MLTKPKVPTLRHVLDIDSLDRNTINYLLDRADILLKQNVMAKTNSDALAGKIVTHLFFESSTRTLSSFMIAANRLGAIALKPHIASMALVKGESLLDTLHVYETMGTDVFVIRHADNHTPHFAASELKTAAGVINAGDGNNQHPTQALLDLMTIRQHKPDIASLRVAIIGDVLHSRVARSVIDGLKVMGCEQIRLVAPTALLPDESDISGVSTFGSMEEGLEQADVVMALRLQKERMQESEIPDPQKFFQLFGLTEERLQVAKPDALVMHPGPLNRGVEIESAVADSPRSVILQQVKNGVAMRMAIMETLCHA